MTGDQSQGRGSMSNPTMSPLEFFGLLRWIDGTPLLIESYRQCIFEEALAIGPDGRRRYNLVLCGRAKKNWKSADLGLMGLYHLLALDSPGGNQCYIIANDLDQAADNLSLAKKILQVNSALLRHVRITQNQIERVDGKGFIEILPAQDVAGSHGKTYLFCGFDEIHAYRNWDLLEAMQLDPTRPDALMWITSYASLYHKPGTPLFDLCQAGWVGNDPRMYFSWYAADRTTDPDFTDADPEARANPSRGSWADPDYLEQQKRRLPSHKFRRLHLNLPGLPEGSPFQPEPVMDAITRSVTRRPPDLGQTYMAFVDMSGGSSDDAALAIGHKDSDGRALVDCLVDQGPRPPFDPRAAVSRFVTILKEYGVSRVWGDRFAGNTFVADFQREGVSYQVSPLSASKLYEALEPRLNGHQVILPDVPTLEQQLLGLRWQGGKIDHPSGEHDDYANAVAGLVHVLLERRDDLQLYVFAPSGEGEVSPVVRDFLRVG